MVKSRYILIVAMIVVAGIWATVFFFPSEDKKVKKQFALLSEWISKDPNESPLTMARKVKNLGTLFAENFELKEPVHPLSGSYTREEITNIALRGRAHFFDLALKFYDLDISFPEEGVARVTVTGRLTGKSSSGEQMDETRELECLLRKIENQWLFSQLEVVEVLKK